MSQSPFDTDKPDLLAAVLDRLGVAYRRTRIGWQPVKCPNTAAHAHGDSNPSGSVNMQVGYFTCHACELKGDGFDLMLELEGVKAGEALTLLGREGGVKEETWLV